MEPDALFYRRRISEELAAAERAITPAGRLRHFLIVEGFANHLERLGERSPISREDLARMKNSELT